MVYRGPSKGCGICRRRRVKCDGGRPACQTCLRLNTECDGYDGFFDRVHRDQTHSLRQKSRVADSSALPNKNRNHRPLPRFSISERTDRKLTPLKISTSQLADYDDYLTAISNTVPNCLQVHFEDFARNVFLSGLATNEKTTSAMGGCIYWVMPMFAQVALDSPLHKAFLAAAVNLGVLWSKKHRWSPLPRKYYAEAVNSLRLAIADDDRNRDDDVLMAAMLLDYFDSIDALSWIGQGRPPRNHRAGAMALARHRGSRNFENEASKSMLVSLQTMFVEEALRSGQGVAPSHQAFFQDSAMPKTLLSSLNALAIELAELLKRAQSHSVRKSIDLRGLCYELIELDTKFDLWHNNFLVNYTPSYLRGIDIPLSVRSAGVYRDACSVYANVEAANLVNLWRYRRILLLSTLRDCIISGQGHDSTLFEGTRVHIDTTTQALADGICESVPFSLGDCGDDTPPCTYSNVASPSASDENSTFPSCLIGHTRLATEGGAWMMLTPLNTLARLMKGTDTLRPIQLRKGQQEWVEGQIQRLHHNSTACTCVEHT